VADEVDPGFLDEPIWRAPDTSELLRELLARSQSEASRSARALRHLAAIRAYAAVTCFMVVPMFMHVYRDDFAADAEWIWNAAQMVAAVIVGLIGTLTHHL